jgi:hypothetical protein
MDLPEEVRRKLENNPDEDEILEVIKSLKADGVTITMDVYTAIITTIRLGTAVIE